MTTKRQVKRYTDKTGLALGSIGEVFHTNDPDFMYWLFDKSLKHKTVAAYVRIRLMEDYEREKRTGA